MWHRIILPLPSPPPPRLPLLPRGCIPTGPSSGQRSLFLLFQRTYTAVPASNNSIPLSSSRPFREISLHRFYLQLLVIPTVHKNRIIFTWFGKVNLQLASLARLVFTVRPPRLFRFRIKTWGRWGGPWVRLPFTIWHANGQKTLHSLYSNINIYIGLAGNGVNKQSWYFYYTWIF